MNSSKTNRQPLLNRKQLLRLYRQRHQFKPTQRELRLIFDSMRHEDDPRSPTRANELGWFWLRNCRRAELARMLASQPKERDPRSFTQARRRRLAAAIKQRPLRLQQLQGDFGTQEERFEAIYSLAIGKNPADLPLLRQLAAEASFPEGWALGPALEMFQEPGDVAILLRLGRRNVVPALEALVQRPDQGAAAAIWKLAREGHDCVRINLAIRLGQWRNPAAARLLRRLARDDDAVLRAAATASLGALRRPADVPWLRKMSRDSSANVRLEALWAVGRQRREADIALLQASAADAAPQVRTVGAMALAQLMPRAALERWLDQEAKRLRFEVLCELDFALYAPAWVQKAQPRMASNCICMGLDMVNRVPDQGDR